MGFVHNDQIPVDLAQTGENVDAFREVERRDDLPLFDPLVHAELVSDVGTFEDDELLVEFFLELTLPLERKIRRRHDEYAFGQTAEFQFPDEQAGHDGLAGARIVGQKKPHAGELEQVVVNRF